ncbi:MAG: hypothetical protein NVS2B14_00310 [Chamaesiphon sp.]
MESSFDDEELRQSLAQRVDLERALTLDPYLLAKWMEENPNPNRQEFAGSIWLKFIMPLQLEIENLRYYPHQAVPLECDEEDVDISDIPFD